MGAGLKPSAIGDGIDIGRSAQVTVNTAIIAVVTTFAGHGLYAAGVWPTPSTFIGMTRSTLVGTTPPQNFLRVAGFLDFIVCCGMFSQTYSGSMLCMLFSGALQRMARPVAGMSWDLNYWGADQFLPELV